MPIINFSYPSKEEIQNIISGTIAARKQFGKDVAGIIANDLVQAHIANKFEAAKKSLPEHPENQLRNKVATIFIKVLK